MKIKLNSNKKSNLTLVKKSNLTLMKNKSTTSVQHAQHLIAGLLQDDAGIEFYGLPETKEVQWIQHGKSNAFAALPIKIFRHLANAYTTNTAAKLTFANTPQTDTSFRRRVELYTYFMYGGCDASPDFVNGELQAPENYRHSENCISLKFKKIKLNGSPLKQRELKMIDLMTEDPDCKDEVIALKMGLATSTYNQHKRELFNKTGIQSKTGIMMAAVRQRVARVFL